VSKKIKVMITVCERATFGGTVEMTQEEYDEHYRKQRTLRGFDRERYVNEVIEDYRLDRHFADYDESEIDDFEIVGDGK
jgi:hypothetical protein